MFHDTVTIKKEEGRKNLCHRHICVDEFVGFKRSKFLEKKIEMPTYMCELMQKEAKQGHPILVIQQDNAGENTKLISLAHAKE